MEEAIRTLERCALTAWPALHTAEHDGWALRTADGYTKRANSANAVGPASASLAEQIARIEAHYKTYTLPAIVRVTPLADPALDGELAARGYKLVDPSLVMVARTARHASDPSACDAPSPWTGWLDAFAATLETPKETVAKLGAVLGFVQPQALFTRIDAAAFAMAVVENGHVGIFEVLCAPHVRRQGFARRVVAHAMAWGFAKGAHTAYLQVADDNAPALALYRELGFAPLYGYHYRIGP